MFFLFENKKFIKIVDTDNVSEGQILKKIPLDYFENSKTLIPVLDSNNDVQLVEENSYQHFMLDPDQVSQNKVAAAIKFGQQVIISFAGENVKMGITQAGKTKDVADYLTDVLRYAQSGSLYEVINEVDRLLQEGLPQELEPFVTEERMTDFKNKIIAYLSG